MTALRDRFNAHQELPFPRGGPPHTAALKSALVDRDSYVAGLASTLLRGGHVSAVLAESGLEEALAAAGEEPFVLELRAYLLELQRLEAAVRHVVSLG